MKNSHHYQIVAESIHFITQRFTAQPSLDEIAKNVNMSRFHFQRLFQQWAGVSPKKFLEFVTLEHAKNSLRNGQSTLNTAFEVGLSGNGRLHDLFIRIEACTPGEFKRRGKGLNIKYSELTTPFGSALIAETDIGICQLTFLDGLTSPLSILQKSFPQASFTEQPGIYSQMVQQYFSDWIIPNQKIVLDLKGTPFQIQVWKALLSIPSSSFFSYQNIANQINNPKAVRAVGTAIGKNPIAYLIPCHRVIRQTGEMGGYRWTTERKKIINGFEAARLGG